MGGSLGWVPADFGGYCGGFKLLICVVVGCVFGFVFGRIWIVFACWGGSGCGWFGGGSDCGWFGGYIFGTETGVVRGFFRWDLVTISRTDLATKNGVLGAILVLVHDGVFMG